MRAEKWSFAIPSIVVLCSIEAAAGADWTNSGGNTGRNGQTSEIGPDSATELWPPATPVPSAIISYQPVIEGNRVFMVRQNSFIPNNVPNDSPIVCKDLHTGVTLWTVNLPYNSGDWTTWIAGVKNGRVYASRSGNGSSVNAKLHCLDAATGAFLWPTGSQDTNNAGSYDGVVFAPNGDPIIGNFNNIRRVNALDGTTVWTSPPRACSVSSSCGVAAFGDALYAVDAVVGGHAVKRFNMNTGAFQYQGPLMAGFTAQNTPMVGPDGTIYFARTQNNVSADFFYAFTDSCSAITIKWSIPARWTTTSEFTIGPDGSVYMIAAGNVVSRRNPVTGAQINASLPIALDSPSGNFSPRMASDAQGRIFLSNGQFSTGRFYSFNADLTDRWSVAVPGINIGAPAIGQDGILVVCGTGTNVKAYDTAPQVKCSADITNDGIVNAADLLLVINSWGPCPAPPGSCPADINNDGVVNSGDLLAVINAWGACP